MPDDTLDKALDYAPAAFEIVALGLSIWRREQLKKGLTPEQVDKALEAEVARVKGKWGAAADAWHEAPGPEAAGE